MRLPGTIYQNKPQDLHGFQRCGKPINSNRLIHLLFRPLITHKHK
uniref:Uncharacterized protein n=1 Tax=Anguilla anguilla TaxID=7936 RepID=A0A0E9SLJ6_ANGAN